MNYLFRTILYRCLLTCWLKFFSLLFFFFFSFPSCSQCIHLFVFCSYVRYTALIWSNGKYFKIFPLNLYDQHNTSHLQFDRIITLVQLLSSLMRLNVFIKEFLFCGHAVCIQWRVMRVCVYFNDVIKLHLSLINSIKFSVRTRVG